MAETPTYVVRFANRSAVQRFQEAKELVESAQKDAPWSDDLRRASECLDEAWSGLSFALPEE